MKITLNASIKEHREIAELVDSEDLSIIKKRGKFAFYIVDESTEKGFVIKDEIILHLDKAPLDLRMAIGTGIELLITRDDDFSFKGSMCSIVKRFRPLTGVEEICINVEDEDCLGLWLSRTKSIKLCPDYLKSVGVEVEE